MSGPTTSAACDPGAAKRTKICFEHLDRFQGWRIDERSGDARDNVALLKSLVIQHGLKRVCEVGAGANPALDDDFVRHEGLTYLTLDQDESELEKSGRTEVAVLDVCTREREIPGAPYNLIFSHMTAEHFRDAEAGRRNRLPHHGESQRKCRKSGLPRCGSRHGAS